MQPFLSKTGAACRKALRMEGIAHRELAAGGGIGNLEGDGSCGSVVGWCLDKECALDRMLHRSSLHIVRAASFKY